MFRMKTGRAGSLVRLILRSVLAVGVSTSPCRGDDAPTVKNVLENGSLEEDVDSATALPAGWLVTQKPPNGYQVTVVEGGRTGKQVPSDSW